MTPREINLVKESFKLVAPIRDQAAALFYQRLLETDVSTRPLFAGVDLQAQGVKLMMAIAYVVRSLAEPDAMLEDVRRLARRHVGYGVEERHYASVGAALLWTLEAGIGRERFTDEVRGAWAAAYALLSSVMIAAARDETNESTEAA
jgi:hemoglobin-like flavoprotein